MRPWYLLIPLFVPACLTDDLEPVPEGPTDPDPDPVVTAVGGPPRQGMETQGRYLLGSGIDDLVAPPGMHFHVRTRGTSITTGATVTVAVTAGATLLNVTQNRVADDLLLTGTAGGELQIDLSRRSADVTAYRLQYRASAGAAWIDPCAGAEAVPLAGNWTRRGLHQDAAGVVSFACADGVAFKCTDWGYRAGAVRATQGWKVHQACTRMARADYCASGTPHTHEGTTISIFDEVGVNPQPPNVFYGVAQWPPPAGGFYFEAGWQDEDRPAVCLSKLRWSGLPLGGYCPSVLPDPRVNVNVKYCDEYGSAEALRVETNTVLFNASRYAELSMHVWKRGTDQVASIDGFYDDENVVPPYRAIGGYTWVRSDGLLLRSLPDSVDSSEVTDVNLYGRGSDLVFAPTTAVGSLPGFVNLGWRGMVFHTARPGAVPLVLYHEPTTDDYVTSSTPLPSSYQTVATVGYVQSLDPPE